MLHDKLPTYRDATQERTAGQIGGKAVRQTTHIQRRDDQTTPHAEPMTLTNVDLGAHNDLVVRDGSGEMLLLCSDAAIL